jgi:molecular chaperone GrpE
MAKKPLAGQPDGAGERAPAGVPEAEEPVGSDAAAKQVSDDIDELSATKRERDEYLELAQRTRADFDNYRKRVAKETADALERGKAELARELVPVLDNLERALKAAGDKPQIQGEGDESLAKGVALVESELRSTLERAGVETYDPAGKPFDPTWHEAISTRAQEGTPAGTVLETIDRGYRLDGQVLRPARVVVSE